MNLGPKIERAVLARSFTLRPALDIAYIWRPDPRTQDILGGVQADLRFVIMACNFNERVVYQQPIRQELLIDFTFLALTVKLAEYDDRISQQCFIFQALPCHIP